MNQELLDASFVGAMNSLKEIYQELANAANSGAVKLTKEQREVFNQDVATVEELTAKIVAKMELLK